MGRWDSGRLVDLDQLDNPEPSRANRERLLWSQNDINSVGLQLQYFVCVAGNLIIIYTCYTCNLNWKNNDIIHNLMG